MNTITTISSQYDGNKYPTIIAVNCLEGCFITESWNAASLALDTYKLHVLQAKTFFEVVAAKHWVFVEHMNFYLYWSYGIPEAANLKTPHEITRNKICLQDQSLVEAVLKRIDAAKAQNLAHITYGGLL